MIRGRVRVLTVALALVGSVPSASSLAAPPAAPSPTESDSATDEAADTSTEAAERKRLEKLAQELDQVAKESGFTGELDRPKSSASGFGAAFTKMILVLGGVCVLAYIILGKVLPRVMRVPAPSGAHRIVSVVDRLPIDPKRSVLVLRVADAHYLVGVTDHNISLIAKLAEEQISQAISESNVAGPSIAERAKSLLDRSRKEN
jgi:flagellar protein FliO/FliZ